MATQYGPWATAINVGRNPQLSPFWRRRLTMLVPTSQTSPVLSRRHLLWLGVAGALMLLLPTLRATPAAADDKKPVTLGKKRPPLDPNEDCLSIAPSPFYANMKDSELVAKIGLTPEQRKQLDALAEKNWSDRMAADRKALEKLQMASKDLQSMPKAKQEEIGKRLWPDYEREEKQRREQNKKYMRKTIEAMLTPQQLQKVKDLAYPELVFCTMQDAKAIKEIGASAEQKEAAHDLGVEALRRCRQVVFDKVDPWLAVFNPEQQTKLKEVAQRRIDTQVATRNAGVGVVEMAGGFGAELLVGGEDLIPAYPELASSLVRHRLRFSEEQETRLRNLVAKVPGARRN